MILPIPNLQSIRVATISPMKRLITLHSILCTIYSRGIAAVRIQDSVVASVAILDGDKAMIFICFSIHELFWIFPLYHA